MTDHNFYTIKGTKGAGSSMTVAESAEMVAGDLSTLKNGTERVHAAVESLEKSPGSAAFREGVVTLGGMAAEVRAAAERLAARKVLDR